MTDTQLEGQKRENRRREPDRESQIGRERWIQAERGIGRYWVTDDWLGLTHTQGWKQKI